MAEIDKKLSEVTAATLPLAGTELAYLVQNGAERRTTTAAIAALAPATSLGYDPATRLLSSSTGEDVTLPLVTTTAAGLVPSAWLTGAEAATLPHIHGGLAGVVYEHVRNVSGAVMPALTPYHVVDSQGDTDRVQIVPADASDPQTMPASGILLTELANNADGHGAIAGVPTGVNTAGNSSGTVLYVGSGVLTPTPPAANVQALAIVGRSHATTGTLAMLSGPALARVAFSGDYNHLANKPTPGGNSGEAQFNNAGAFAGASGLTYDATTGRLTLASFLAATGAPAAPASAGFTLYAAPTTGALSWRGANGFIRTLNATGNTADRAYQFQDKSGTLAHLDDVFNGYATSNYIMPVDGTVATGLTLGVNTIYLFPFAVKRSVRCNEIGTRVATAIASSSFQLAIYDTANALPGAVIASTADMSGATAAQISSGVTEFALLAGRLYWFAVNGASGLAFMAPAAANNYANALIGVDTLASISASSTSVAWNRSFSQAYGTWPNLTGQSTTVLAATRCPSPILRVSAL